MAGVGSVTSKSHPLAHRAKLKLEDVEKEPFMLLNGDTELTGSYYLKMFEHDNLVPNLIGHGMDWLSLLVEISSGKCLTIAPKSNLQSYDIASVTLDHPMRMCGIHLAWPMNRKLTLSSNYVKSLILNYYEK